MCIASFTQTTVFTGFQSHECFCDIYEIFLSTNPKTQIKFAISKKGSNILSL